MGNHSLILRSGLKLNDDDSIGKVRDGEKDPNPRKGIETNVQEAPSGSSVGCLSRLVSHQGQQS